MAKLTVEPSWLQFPDEDFEGFFDTESRAPLCHSLETYEEVVGWSSKKDTYSVATIPFPLGLRIEKNRRQRYGLHDVTNAYPDDKFIQGVKKNENYRFCYWQFIDSFIYYDNRFVTIPPPSWTNAAHKHGVLVLGVINAELGEGEARFRKIMADENSYKQFADILVKVFLHYGFDGWLLNFAVNATAKEVSNTIAFVSYLRARMHSSGNYNAQLLWYDSMTKGGKIEWQSELNDKNKCFFDVADGILLHYAWNQKKLQHTAKTAFTSKRMYDVIVGIDMSARGPGVNGGLNINEAFTASLQYDMSVAIYGIGWAFKKYGKEKFIENDVSFWTNLLQDLPATCKIALPISTTFCQGAGEKVFQNGQILSEDPWSNMSVQNLQPFWVNDTDPTVTESLDIHTADALHGGNCVKISTDLKYKAYDSFRLFNLEVETNSELLLSYTFKELTKSKNTVIRMSLTLSLSGQKNDTEYLLCEKDDRTRRASRPEDEAATHNRLFSCSISGQTEYLIPLQEEELKNYFSKYVLDVDLYDWKTRYYRLPIKAATLKSLDVQLVSTKPTQGDPDVKVLLGQVQIISQIRAKEAPLPEDLHFIATDSPQGKKCLTLTWNYPEGLADNFLIFQCKANTASNMRLSTLDIAYYSFLGYTHLTHYRVGDVDRSYIFKVQPVTKSGTVIPLEEVPYVTYAAKTASSLLLQM